MPFHADPVVLTAAERAELEQMSQSRTLAAGDVFRARLILLLAGGVPYRTIQQRLHTSAPSIVRWKDRFEKQRLDGLREIRHPGQKPSVRTAKLHAKVLNLVTRRKPKDGSTHWSCRKLARELGVSKASVQRILVQADLRPHRLERYMASRARRDTVRCRPRFGPCRGHWRAGCRCAPFAGGDRRRPCRPAWSTACCASLTGWPLP